MITTVSLVTIHHLSELTFRIHSPGSFQVCARVLLTPVITQSSTAVLTGPHNTPMVTPGLVPRFSTFLRAAPCSLHPGFKTGPPPAALPPGTDLVHSAPSPSLPSAGFFFLPPD